DPTPYLMVISCSSSVFNLTTLTLPLNSSAIASTAGATARQEPHHGAQKSTSTGVPALSTSESKLASVTGMAFDMGLSGNWGRGRGHGCRCPVWRLPRSTPAERLHYVFGCGSGRWGARGIAAVQAE